MIANPASSKNILIVDDTPANLAILGEMLMPHYHVRIANSGERALTAVLSDPKPDLILLDIMMPGMDGYEVLTRLKANPQTREIPVMFITALESSDDEAHGLELGAVDYLAKPLKPAIVLARVHSQLELKDARDLLRDKNNWLESEVNRRIQQYQKIQDISMRALASLAEARDNETGNHILRTQSYVNLLAKQLARHPKYAAILSETIIDFYTKASPLHDIGKVGIPDEILHKPGKHTPEEWAIMQTHAQIGADAIWRAIQDEEDIEAVKFLYVAMEIAGSHHEKWDGSGYPAGLREEQIPLSAQLMALADVFDALMSRRIYKPAFSFAESYQIILQGSGSHFNPDLVETFKQCTEEFKLVAARFTDDTAKLG